MRVHVTRNIPQPALQTLFQTGWDIFVGPEEIPSRSRLLWAATGAHGLLSLLTERIDAEVMDRCPQLKVISNCAVGVDNIDLAEASARGIVVCNTPGVLTEACADFTWALLLGLRRRLLEGDQWVRSGRFEGWGPLLLLGGDLHDCQLGLVGMGAIAQAVARRAAGFGSRVHYWSRTAREGPWQRHLQLETLLQECDVVSLHVPLSAKTHHLLNRQRLLQMRADALLINTSRGPIVDEAALAEVLAEGHLGGAALDVYEREPEVHPGLLTSPRVLLAPHLASATRGTRLRMAELAVENLCRVLRGESPLHQVG